MQLWEAIIWKGFKCKLFSQVAMTTNLLQPLGTAILLLIYAYKHEQLTSYDTPLVVLLLIIYSIYVGRFYSKDYGCIKDKNGINYRWWNKNYGGVLYNITMIAVMVLLLKNRKLLAFQIGYFLVTLLLSNLFYRRTTGGSIWCFLAAFAPIYNYIVFKNL